MARRTCARKWHAARRRLAARKTKTLLLHTWDPIARRTRRRERGHAPLGAWGGRSPSPSRARPKGGLPNSAGQVAPRAGAEPRPPFARVVTRARDSRPVAARLAPRLPPRT